jgi:flagellar protein FlaG
MLIDPVGNTSPATMVPGKASSAAQPSARVAPQFDDVQLKQAIAAANRAVAEHNSSIEFSVDPQQGTTIVRVVDTNTGDVIRQMPSEEMIQIAKALDQFQGMLIRRRA